MPWWDLYAHKCSRDDAEKAWTHDLTDEDRESIFDLTVSYLERRSRATISGAFVPTQPMPATYLRSRRWRDEFKVEQSAATIDESWAPNI